ncbi:3-isopropylmalate dehydratase large subunit [Bienertia sinuspersici]
MAMAWGVRVQVQHLLLFGKMKQLAAATAANFNLNCKFSSTSTSMDRGKLASMRHHSNIERLRSEISDEVDVAHSIDNECPYLSQASHHLYWNNDYKSLKDYLQTLRTFNLENKDAPRVRAVNDKNDEIENYGFLFNGLWINPHLKALTPAEIQQHQKEKAEKDQKQALQIAHMIINRYNKDQSLKSGQKVNLEFVRVVRVAKTFHPLVHRIVVEASNPHAAAGIPPIIRLEATFNWYIGKPHRPSYLPPPYPDSPTLAPSSLEVQVEQEAQANKVVAGHEHNVTASTQAASDPIWDKTKMHEMGKFDEEAEVKLKELKHSHKKEVEKKGVDNLTTLEACEEVLGKGHTSLKKDDKKSKVEMQSAVQSLQEVRDEIKFLKEERLRKEQEAKEREERLEKKLQFIMDKLHLTA